jgi:arylformamidase
MLNSLPHRLHSMAVNASSIVDPVVEARRAAQRAASDALRAEFRHDRDVAYGDHPKQVMDMYYPTAVTTAAPVLVFLHGGGFRAGSPSLNGYQGRPYLERGSLFVSMGYRLTPEMRFPDTCADVEQGLRWLVEHVAKRGGDPSRIYVSGHSAGAMLAASVGLRSWPLDVVQGLVLISGMYDVSHHSTEMVNPDSPRYVANLANAIERIPPHTILVAGDNDLPAVLPDAHALVAAIQSRGGSVEMFVEPDADHFAANRGFISSDGQVFQATSRMMRLS